MHVQALNKAIGLPQPASVTAPPGRCCRLRCQCSRQPYVEPNVNGRRRVYDPEVLPEDEARGRSWPPPPPPPPPRPVVLLQLERPVPEAFVDGLFVPV